MAEALVSRGGVGPLIVGGDSSGEEPASQGLIEPSRAGLPMWDQGGA